MTSVSVGIVPDEQIVVLSVDDASTAMPSIGAVKVGMLLMKAGLQVAATIVSPESLEGIALMLGHLDGMLATLDS